MSALGSSMTVQLALDRVDFQPGETVNARVLVAGQRDRHVQGGRVELVYADRYLDRDRDRQDAGTRTVTRTQTIVVASQPLAAALDAPVALGEHALAFAFPPDAPPSAHEPAGFGDVIRWELRAILDRRMAFDPDATQQLTVRSPAAQYGHWGQTPIVAKDPECPMALELRQRSLRPGDELSGTLSVTPRSSFRGRAVRVHLERRRIDTPDNLERTETLPGVQLAAETEFEAGRTLSFPFRISLPQAVPPTFNAACNHLHWYLEGLVDRKLRSDYVVEAEVVVYTGSVPDAASARPSTPAGWYADPGGQARLRYWDGSAWTVHTAD